MALALRGPSADWPLPGMGNDGLHGLGRPFDAIGMEADLPDLGYHLIIKGKILRLPLTGIPVVSLTVVSYDAGDIVRQDRMGGHPGVVALWLSSFSEVGSVGPEINPSTVDPADYIVPGL